MNNDKTSQQDRKNNIQMRILFGGDHGQEGMKCDVVNLEHGIVRQTSLYGIKHI